MLNEFRGPSIYYACIELLVATILNIIITVTSPSLQQITNSLFFFLLTKLIFK